MNGAFENEDNVRIRIHPLREAVTVPRGSRLHDVLFRYGVEFPCGGHGRCKGCRIRVQRGTPSITAEDARLLSARELAEGWRLACQARAEDDLELELAQWEAVILEDRSALECVPRDGLGVVVDVGTTTLVAQLLDLRTGVVRGVRSALNAQARHGADIMSRIEFAVHGGGQPILQRLIREQIGEMIRALVASEAAAERELAEVVLVGNTVMHHLFSGCAVEPLARYPFEPEEPDVRTFSAEDLEWNGGADARVRFLPCLGGFVGSDVLAGVLATRMHESERLVALIDLGTNGEIVVGNCLKMLCASTAAGPAFEGARISSGMRACTGAISEVAVHGDQLQSRVLGDVPARGICGSGLVDAVAGGLELGWIASAGRLTRGSIPLAPAVTLTQSDVRELQLAKGAIAAGLNLLLQLWGASQDDVDRIYLAGAFGNYINHASARRIGLLQYPTERIVASGNTALRGAKLTLLGAPDRSESFATLRGAIHHVALNDSPAFAESFVEQLPFPAESSGAGHGF